MSISNLFVPNDYDLFADSLTTNSLTTNSFSTGTITASELDTNLIRSNPPNTANIVIAGLTLNTSNELVWPPTTDGSKIILYRVGTGAQQYYGFGVNANTLVYNTGVTSADHVFYAASAPTTLVELFRVKGNGGGFILPSVGASVAAQLNYYEVYDVSITFAGAIPPTNLLFSITRLGNIVTITNFSTFSATATATGIISSFGAVPARFRPVGTLSIPIIVNNNTPIMGLLQIINSTGDMDISAGLSPLNFFTAGNAAEFPQFTVSYAIS
jgi:hypothetical protein